MMNIYTVDEHEVIIIHQPAPRQRTLCHGNGNRLQPPTFGTRSSSYGSHSFYVPHGGDEEEPNEGGGEDSVGDEAEETFANQAHHVGSQKDASLEFGQTNANGKRRSLSGRGEPTLRETCTSSLHCPSQASRRGSFGFCAELCRAVSSEAPPPNSLQAQGARPRAENAGRRENADSMRNSSGRQNRNEPSRTETLDGKRGGISVEKGVGKLGGGRAKTPHDPLPLAFPSAECFLFILSDDPRAFPGCPARIRTAVAARPGGPGVPRLFVAAVSPAVRATVRQTHGAHPAIVLSSAGETGVDADGLPPSRRLEDPGSMGPRLFQQMGQNGRSDCVFGVTALRTSRRRVLTLPLGPSAWKVSSWRGEGGEHLESGAGGEGGGDLLHAALWHTLSRRLQSGSGCSFGAPFPLPVLLPESGSSIGSSVQSSESPSAVSEVESFAAEEEERSLRDPMEKIEEEEIGESVEGETSGLPVEKKASPIPSSDPRHASPHGKAGGNGSNASCAQLKHQQREQQQGGSPRASSQQVAGASFAQGEKERNGEFEFHCDDIDEGVCERRSCFCLPWPKSLWPPSASPSFSFSTRGQQHAACSEGPRGWSSRRSAMSSRVQRKLGVIIESAEQRKTHERFVGQQSIASATTGGGGGTQSVDKSSSAAAPTASGAARGGGGGGRWLSVGRLFSSRRGGSTSAVSAAVPVAGGLPVDTWGEWGETHRTNSLLHLSRKEHPSLSPPKGVVGGKKENEREKDAHMHCGGSTSACASVSKLLVRGDEEVEVPSGNVTRRHPEVPRLCLDRLPLPLPLPVAQAVRRGDGRVDRGGREEGGGGYRDEIELGESSVGPLLSYSEDKEENGEMEGGLTESIRDSMRGLRGGIGVGVGAPSMLETNRGYRPETVALVSSAPPAALYQCKMTSSEAFSLFRAVSRRDLKNNRDLTVVTGPSSESSGREEAEKARNSGSKIHELKEDARTSFAATVTTHSQIKVEVFLMVFETR